MAIEQVSALGFFESYIHAASTKALEEFIDKSRAARIADMMASPGKRTIDALLEVGRQAPQSVNILR